MNLNSPFLDLRTSSKDFFVLLICCLINLNLVLAQNEEKPLSSITSLKKVIPLNNAFPLSEISNLKFATFNQSLRFCHYNVKNNTDSVWIYNLNLENFVIDSTVYVIENLSNYLQKNYSKSVSYIAFNQHWTVIGVYGLMYIYDDKNTLYKKIEMQDPLKFVKFIDENQLLCAWNFNTKNKKIKPSAINLFDVEKGEYLKSTYPNFDIIQYSQFVPNHFFDATEKSILYSQTVDYKINIYDRDFNFIDSIRNEPNGWIKLPKEIRDEIVNKKPTGADAIYKVLPYEKTTSRLRQVHLINDTTIFTYYSVPNIDSTMSGPNFAFDVWRRNAKGWQLSNQKLVDRYSNDEIITASNYPLFVDKLSELITFSGQYLIAFMPYAPINPIGLSKQVYKQQCDDYLLDNSPRLVLYVYALKLN